MLESSYLLRKALARNLVGQLEKSAAAGKAVSARLLKQITSPKYPTRIAKFNNHADILNSKADLFRAKAHKLDTKRGKGEPKALRYYTKAQGLDEQVANLRLNANKLQLKQNKIYQRAYKPFGTTSHSEIRQRARSLLEATSGQ